MPHSSVGTALWYCPGGTALAVLPFCWVAATAAGIPPTLQPLLHLLVPAGVGLENLGGVWVGDRSLSDISQKFVPTPDNVVNIPTMEEIIDQVGWWVRLGVVTC